MNPQNIDLQSQINTSDSGSLISKEPLFEKKNSLLYKGLLSNLQTKDGEGFLSTTGKKISYDNSTLQAGSELFTLDNKQVVSDLNSGNKGNDDIAIKNYVMSSSSDKLEIKKGDTKITTITVNADNVWKTTVWGHNEFAYVYNKGDTYNFKIVDVNGVEKFTKSYKFGEDDHFLPGETITVWVKDSKYAFGFDDIDYRKRFTVLFDNGTCKVIRGFGSISYNGKVYGEPIPKASYRGQAFEDLGTAEYTPIVDAPFVSVGGPDIYNNPRYKILDNGVISYWNGWFNPDKTSKTIDSSKTFLQLITDENAALGASLTEASGTQEKSGRGDWHAKIHSSYGAADLNHPRGQEYQEGNLDGNTASDYHYSTIRAFVDSFVASDVMSGSGSGDIYTIKDGVSVAMTSVSKYVKRFYVLSNSCLILFDDGTLSTFSKTTPYFFIVYRGSGPEHFEHTIPNMASTLVSSGSAVKTQGTLYSFKNNGGAVLDGKRIDTLTIGEEAAIVYFKDSTSKNYTTTGPVDIYGVKGYYSRSGGDNRYWVEPSAYQSSPNFGAESQSTYAHWICGVDLNNMTDIDLGLTATQSKIFYSFTANNNDSFNGGIQWVNVFGDWTYNYDSMKDFSNTSDYDGVFPALRLFFNSADSKGKYFDYGNGWFTCYKWSLGFNQSNKEVNVFTQPLELVRLTPTKSDYTDRISSRLNKAGSLSFKSKDDVKNFIEVDTVNLHNGAFILEPLGNLYRTEKRDDETTQKTTDYFNAYKNIWSSTGDQTRLGKDYFANVRSANNLENFIRRIDILGEGKGLEEQTFNFGGLGDNTLIPSLNFTVNLLDDDYVRMNNQFTMPSAIENTDKLRLQIYSGLDMALTYNGTLLFNAGALENKYHVFSDTDGLHITVYSGKKWQYLTIKQNGDIVVDKLSDYIYRINSISGNNILIESHEGSFSLIKGFNGFIGEDRPYVGYLTIKLPEGTNISSNNTLFYAAGIATNMLDEEKQPSFLLPQKTIASYVNPSDNKDFEKTVLKNKNGFIKQLILNPENKIDVYYTSTNSTTDNSYKETDIVPSSRGSFEGFTGVQSLDRDLQDATYWINGDTIIYPIGIGSSFSGVNYISPTVELPDNYYARLYNNNNRTWLVYNQNSQIHYGNNIFTIMGGNYYFDGAGIYYIGDAKYNQYSENILIAYAVGMRFLCSAPSEAYFYSPFDKNLYVFTASNTMQKSISFAKFGNVIDSCYSPVSQSVYLLFDDGNLFIKSQDDSALIEDVEGNKLLTTADGVQIIDGDSYSMVMLENGEGLLPLDVETEFLGSPDILSKFAYIDLLFYGSDDTSIDFEISILDKDVRTEKSTIDIKSSDWDSGLYRIRLQPNNNVGNAIKFKLHSDSYASLFNATIYMEQASIKNTAEAWV